MSEVAHSPGGEESLSADAVVLATGFRVPARHPLLAAVDGYLLRDESGGYRVEEYHRIATSDAFRPRIFVGAYLEAALDLQDVLPATFPVRSARILRSLDVGAASPAAEVREVMV